MTKVPADILEIIKYIIPSIEKEDNNSVEYEQPRLEIPIYEDWSETPKEEKPTKIEIQL